MVSCCECFLDQCARLLQLGNSSIMIGTQFDKAFLDPGLVFCIGLGNLIIQRADFDVGVLLEFLQLRLRLVGQFIELRLNLVDAFLKYRANTKLPRIALADRAALTSAACRWIRFAICRPQARLVSSTLAALLLLEPRLASHEQRVRAQIEWRQRFGD
jgi:hypothetical protein